MKVTRVWLLNKLLECVWENTDSVDGLLVLKKIKWFDSQYVWEMLVKTS